MGITEVLVDAFGADPYDDQPDSDAIQAALGALRTGETLVFSSGTGPDYAGYLIDKTLFLMMDGPKSNLTLTSSDPDNPASLIATEDLLGFMIHLYSRARYSGSPGQLDDITLQYLHLDGGSEYRKAAGSDEIPNGIDDHWGSWVAGECTEAGDSWCNPGGISIPGGIDPEDPAQDYRSAPSKWSTGLSVDHLTITNVESGTALGFTGAASSITNNVIDSAGEHTHIDGCAVNDPDGELSQWADGITADGTDLVIEHNTVINATDVAIVFFGGRGARINHNTVISRKGNNGAFAGIAVHTWGPSDISGLEINDNNVVSRSDTECGGIHAGINIGTHMWGAGCRIGWYGNVGNPNTCEVDPAQPEGQPCAVGEMCQLWAYLPAGATASLQDNRVKGAQINYLIEGFDIQGELIIDGNESLSPQETDWHAATFGCDGETWGPLDYVAHHPSLPGWTDQVVHCEW
ncbi:MAG: hypothetical protein KQH83_02320 [Actinobacteria bacterium]|nr:hypothetical protein [Actinomycetota bacterium]